jgi:catechol 2,3-dioxygenase-like lactoylglutathione lyase family enzyme
MTTKPVLDHLALAVPNLDQLVERLTGAFGMVVEQQFDGFAVLVDPGSGLKFELAGSADADVHFRHLGFRADDVDRAHASLVDGGMRSKEAPVRQDFAGMYQSRLQEPDCLEIQLVTYD